MTKPSPTDATTKLDAARKAVSEHLKDLIDWRSSMMRRGNKTLADEAWSHITELREVSDQLDLLVRSWNKLTVDRDIAPSPHNPATVVNDVPKTSQKWNSDRFTTPRPLPTLAVTTTEKSPSTQPAPTKSAATVLRIVLPNRIVIKEPTAAMSLVKFIEWVGIERVMPLGLTVNREPLISPRPLEKHFESSWKFVDPYFVQTHSSTRSKLNQIVQISNALNLNVQVTQER